MFIVRRKMNRLILKGTSFFTALAFSFTQLSASGYAALPVASEVVVTRGFEIQIPEALGSIDAIHAGSGPTVIHVQTAHGNFEAQKSIQALLRHLKSAYGIKTLLLEGSAMELKPEMLRFFPGNSELTMKINEGLTRKALVKGAELFLVEDAEAKGYGIEERDTFMANGKAFREVLSEQERTGIFIEEMNLQIERLAGAFLGKDLRAFLKRLEAFETGKVPFQEWLATLKDWALKTAKIDVTDAAYQIDWPMMTRFWKMTEFEKRMDWNAYPLEREKFLKELRRFKSPVYADVEALLSESFTRNSLQGPQVQQLFEKMVQSLPARFDYSFYPNLGRFIGHLLLQSEFKAGLLADEMDKLSEEIIRALARSPEEKELAGLLKDYRLLQRLFLLQLTPGQYEALLAREENLMPEAIAGRFLALNRSGRVRNAHFPHAKDLTGLFHKALEFYRLVKERDVRMIENIVRRLKELEIDKAVLITGGFHAEPFQEFFESKGFSYARISPRIEKFEEDAERSAYVNSILQTSPNFLTRATYESLSLAHSWSDLKTFDFYNLAWLLGEMLKEILPPVAEALPSNPTLLEALNQSPHAKESHSYSFDRNRKAIRIDFKPGMITAGAKTVRVPLRQDKKVEVRTTEKQIFVPLLEGGQKSSRSELRSPKTEREIVISELAEKLNGFLSVRERVEPESMEKHVVALRSGTQQVIAMRLDDGSLDVSIVKRFLNVLTPEEIANSHRILSAVLRRLDKGSYEEKRFFTENLWDRIQDPDQKGEIYEMTAAGRISVEGMGGFAVFPARVKLVPSALNKVATSGLQDTKGLAIFPAESNMADMDGVPSLHLFNAIAFVRFYERPVGNQKAIIVSHVQSDAYQYLKQNAEFKKKYRDWRWVVRAALENYARRHGVDLILSPEGTLISKRWPSITEATARVVYDVEMDRHGFHSREFEQPINWESDIDSKTWWVKEIPANEAIGSQLENLFKSEPAGGQAAEAPHSNRPEELKRGEVTATQPSFDSKAVKRSELRVTIMDKENKNAYQFEEIPRGEYKKYAAIAQKLYRANRISEEDTDEHSVNRGNAAMMFDPAAGAFQNPDGFRLAKAWVLKDRNERAVGFRLENDFSRSRLNEAINHSRNLKEVLDPIDPASISEGLYVVSWRYQQRGLGTGIFEESLKSVRHDPEKKKRFYLAVISEDNRFLKSGLLRAARNLNLPVWQVPGYSQHYLVDLFPEDGKPLPEWMNAENRWGLTAPKRSELRSGRIRLQKMTEEGIGEFMKEYTLSRSDQFLVPEIEVPQEVYNIQTSPQKIVQLLAERNWYLGGRPETEIRSFLRSRLSNLRPDFLDPLKSEIAAALQKRLKREFSPEDIVSLGSMGSFWYADNGEEKQISDLDLMVVVKQPGIQLLDYKVSLKEGVLFRPDASRVPADRRIQLMVLSREYFENRKRLTDSYKIARQIRYESIFRGGGILLEGKDFWSEPPLLSNILQAALGILLVGDLYALSSNSFYRILKANRRWREALAIFKKHFPQAELSSLGGVFEDTSLLSKAEFSPRHAEDLHTLFIEEMGDLWQNEKLLKQMIEKDLREQIKERTIYRARSELRAALPEEGLSRDDLERFRLSLTYQQEKIIAEIVREPKPAGFVINHPYRLDSIDSVYGGRLKDEELLNFLKMSAQKVGAKRRMITQKMLPDKKRRYSEAWDELSKRRNLGRYGENYQKRRESAIRSVWNRIKQRYGSLEAVRNEPFDNLAAALGFQAIPRYEGSMTPLLTYVSQQDFRRITQAIEAYKREARNPFQAPETQMPGWWMAREMNGPGNYYFPDNIEQGRKLKSMHVGKSALFHELLEEAMTLKGVFDNSLSVRGNPTHSDFAVIEEELKMAALIGREEFDGALRDREGELKILAGFPGIEKDERFPRFERSMRGIIDNADFESYRKAGEERWNRARSELRSMEQTRDLAFVEAIRSLDLSKKSDYRVLQAIRHSLEKIGKKAMRRVPSIKTMPEGALRYYNPNPDAYWMTQDYAYLKNKIEIVEILQETAEDSVFRDYLLDVFSFTDDESAAFINPEFLRLVRTISSVPENKVSRNEKRKALVLSVPEKRLALSREYRQDMRDYLNLAPSLLRQKDFNSRQAVTLGALYVVAEYGFLGGVLRVMERFKRENWARDFIEQVRQIPHELGRRINVLEGTDYRRVWELFPYPERSKRKKQLLQELAAVQKEAYRRFSDQPELEGLAEFAGELRQILNGKEVDFSVGNSQAVSVIQMLRPAFSGDAHFRQFVEQLAAEGSHDLSLLRDFMLAARSEIRPGRQERLDRLILDGAFDARYFLSMAASYLALGFTAPFIITAAMVLMTAGPLVYLRFFIVNSYVKNRDQALAEFLQRADQTQFLNGLEILKSVLSRKMKPAMLESVRAAVRRIFEDNPEWTVARRRFMEILKSYSVPFGRALTRDILMRGLSFSAEKPEFLVPQDRIDTLEILLKEIPEESEFFMSIMSNEETYQVQGLIHKILDHDRSRKNGPDTAVQSLGKETLARLKQVRKLNLVRQATGYMGALSEDDAFPEPPSAFLVLGNPVLETYLQFVPAWKFMRDMEGVQVPVVLAGGIGRGTLPLAEAVLGHYSVQGRLSEAEEQFLKEGIEKLKVFLQTPAAADRKQIINEVQLMRMVLLKEEIPEEFILEEENLSTKTAENFQFSENVIREQVKQFEKPVIGLVTAPHLLLRAKPFAEREWKKPIENEGWQIKRFKTFDMRPSSLSPAELIELLGYAAGYPQKYADQYPSLNRYSELKGYQDVLGENSPLTQADWDRLENVKKHFEDYLNDLELDYDPVHNQLVPREADGKIRSELRSPLILSADQNWTEAVADASRPNILEVGFGQYGNVLSHFAYENPDKNYFVIETEDRFVTTAARMMEAQQLLNVRLISADAVEALENQAEMNEGKPFLDAFHLFYPFPSAPPSEDDDEIKMRTRERNFFSRLEKSGHLFLLPLLRPGALLRLATENSNLASRMQELAESWELEKVEDDRDFPFLEDYGDEWAKYFRKGHRRHELTFRKPEVRDELALKRAQLRAQNKKTISLWDLRLPENIVFEDSISQADRQRLVWNLSRLSEKDFTLMRSEPIKLYVSPVKGNGPLREHPTYTVLGAEYPRLKPDDQNSNMPKVYLDFVDKNKITPEALAKLFQLPISRNWEQLGVLNRVWEWRQESLRRAYGIILEAFRKNWKALPHSAEEKLEAMDAMIAAARKEQDRSFDYGPLPEISSNAMTAREVFSRELEAHGKSPIDVHLLQFLKNELAAESEKPLGESSIRSELRTDADASVQQNLLRTGRSELRSGAGKTKTFILKDRSRSAVELGKLSILRNEEGAAVETYLTFSARTVKANIRDQEVDAREIMTGIIDFEAPEGPEMKYAVTLKDSAGKTLQAKTFERTKEEQEKNPGRNPDLPAEYFSRVAEIIPSITDEIARIEREDSAEERIYLPLLRKLRQKIGLVFRVEPSADTVSMILKNGREIKIRPVADEMDGTLKIVFPYEEDKEKRDPHQYLITVEPAGKIPVSLKFYVSRYEGGNLEDQLEINPEGPIQGDTVFQFEDNEIQTEFEVSMDDIRYALQEWLEKLPGEDQSPFLQEAILKTLGSLFKQKPQRKKKTQTVQQREETTENLKAILGFLRNKKNREELTENLKRFAEKVEPSIQLAKTEESRNRYRKLIGDTLSLVMDLDPGDSGEEAVSFASKNPQKRIAAFAFLQGFSGNVMPHFLKLKPHFQEEFPAMLELARLFQARSELRAGFELEFERIRYALTEPETISGEETVEAVRDALGKEDFVKPVLEKALPGASVEDIDKISVHFLQEGKAVGGEGILKADILLKDGRSEAFVIVVPKNVTHSPKVRQNYENLKELHALLPQFIVEPIVLTQGSFLDANGDSRILDIYATVFLKEVLEVNMFSEKVFELNPYPSQQISLGLGGTEIAKAAMIKVLSAVYAKSGKVIAHPAAITGTQSAATGPEIQAGDFVMNRNEGSEMDLKLITARDLISGMSPVEFIHSLARHEEMPIQIPKRSWEERKPVRVFSREIIYKGLELGLKEMYGQAAGAAKAADWIAAYEKAYPVRSELRKLALSDQPSAIGKKQKADSRGQTAESSNILNLTPAQRVIIKNFRDGILPYALILGFPQASVIAALKTILGREVYARESGIVKAESVLHEKIGTKTPLSAENFFKAIFEARQSVASQSSEQGAGKVFFDASMLLKIASENPRALFLLISSAAKLQDSLKTGEPLLATVISEQGEKDFLRKITAALRHQKAAGGAEISEAAILEKKMTSLITIIRIPAGKDQVNGVREFIKAQHGGVALWLDQNSALFEISSEASFSLGQEIHRDDWVYIALASLLTEPAAQLVRFIQDPKVRAEKINEYVASHLPGFTPSEQGFVLSVLQSLAEAFHNQEYIGTMA
jgi:tRNA G46 methylase TrmB